MRNRVAAAVGVVLAVALSGCVFGWPGRTPYDPGIPEARAEAQEQLDDLVAGIRFSSRVEVLATGQADGCGIITSGQIFSTDDKGYRCNMGWMAVAVIPDAQTREEVAAAVDAEFEAMGVPYEGSMVRSFLQLYPTNRPTLPMHSGWYDGAEQMSVEADPFRAEFWRTPRVPHPGSGQVSESGDLDEVTADVVGATGATEVVTVGITVEYWNTGGIPVDDLPEPDPLGLTHWAYGDLYGYDIALPEPAGAADACLADPRVDPGTIVDVDAPFPRLQFSLVPDAESLDMQRVRDCLTEGLTAGTLIVFTPYE